MRRRGASAYLSEHVVVLLAEFDRRGERIRNLEAGRDVEQHALRNALGVIQQLEVDLARALPVVEAAKAVLAFRGDSQQYRDQTWWAREADLLDALARAVKGEQG